MKRLLALIFAMLVCPLFANGKIDNAQLLSHLKMMRTEYVLELIAGEQICPCHLSSQEEKEFFNYMDNFLHEFYNKAEILQKIVTDQIIRPEFDLICNNILPLDEIVKKIEKLPTHQKMNTLVSLDDDLHDPVEISDQIKQDLFELFDPILKKSYRDYCEKIKIDVSEEEITDERIKSCFADMLYEIICHPEVLGNDFPLLKLIDAKIAELEAQI